MSFLDRLLRRFKNKSDRELETQEIFCEPAVEEKTTEAKTEVNDLVEEQKDEEMLSSNLIDDEFADFENESEWNTTSDLPPTNVYLGVDFGTSFSKLAYWVDSNNRGVIDVDGQFFIDTAVFIDDRTISINQKGKNSVEIRYFKYEMIPGEKNGSLFNKTMKDSIRRLTNNNSNVSFSRNCAVYYVSYLLKRCGVQMSQKFSNIRFIINMGMPVAKQRVFEEILYCAYRLFCNGEASETMDYGFLSKRCDAYLQELGTQELDSNYPLYVTSEVIAEADFLLHQETYGVGQYVIADIGGGTADYAFVQKCAGTDMGAYDLIWYSIVPHGIETAKTNPQYTSNLRKTYFDFLMNSKTCIGNNYVNDVTYILFGGGASDDSVKEVFRDIDRKYPDLKKKFTLQSDNRDFPVHHQVGHLQMSESDKKRLVIACQLSYPDRQKIALMPPTAENMKAIEAFNAKEKQTSRDFHEKLEDRQRELYGN